MYRKYFGLNGLPFKSSPDLDIFYRSGSRQNILEALIYTVTRGDGITKVTGEVGSGKTMLLRLLANSLSEEFVILYINTPSLSPKDMLLHIGAELGLDIDASIRKFSILDLINKELVRLYSEGKRVVVLIDEAQAMTFDTLEEVRLLSNLETESDKLLQIVFFGQPELDIALDNDKLRQLKSRISYSIFIPALSPEEVNSYLNYRVRKSNYEGLDLFDMQVSKKIHKLSGGIPRTINMIADKLLMSAYSCDSEKVTKEHIKMLPKELAGVSFIQSLNRFRFFLFLSLLLLVFIALYWYFSLTLFNKTESSLASKGDFSKNIENPEKSVKSSLKNEAINSLDEVKIVDHEKRNLLTERILTVVPEQIKVESEGKQSVHGEKQLVRTEILNFSPSFLERLKGLHLNAVEWLEKMPKDKTMYIIQLAYPQADVLEDTIAFYRNQKIPFTSLNFLIDVNQDSQKARVRVLYLASTSYSTLQRIISEFSPEVKQFTPYVVTVEGVLKNLEYTQNYLKEYGIINVSQ